jgi:hypothetical protein
MTWPLAPAGLPLPLPETGPDDLLAAPIESVEFDIMFANFSPAAVQAA